MNEVSNLPELVEFPVQVPIDVAWGEMDAYQHVNNVVYFRYFETARVHYHERCGFAAVMAETGVGPILHSTHCRYRAPLFFPDRIIACARVAALGEDRAVMEYVVYSTKLERVAAEGGGIVVAYDYRRHCKAPVPQAVREAILALEPKRPADYAAGERG